MNGLMGNMKPEEETRRVNATALWEDVVRPVAQALAYGLSIVWQIIAVLAAMTAWAYAWSQSKTWEGPRNADVASLLSAAAFVVSFPVIGYIISTNRFIVMFEKVIGQYDDVEIEDAKTPEQKRRDIQNYRIGRFIVLSVAVVILNWLFNRTVVYVILTSQIIPIMATIIATGSWFAVAPLREGLREDMRANARNNSSQYHIAMANNRHALEVLRLQHEWELDRGVDVLAIERDRDIAQQSANALAQELDEVKARPPDMVVIPSNHGAARFIGDRKFTGNEVDALTRYITGWAERGTGVKAWATVEGRSKYNGQGISDPQWRKFTDMLKAIGYMDGQNQPTLQADDILSRFKLTPPPEVVVEPEGVNPIVEPNQTKPNQEILQSAIDKIPQRRTAK